MIDAGVALDLLAAAVRRHGADFVYRPVWVEQGRYLTCRYANEDAPSCLVGHALADAGVDVAVLEQMSDSGVEELYREGRFPMPVTLGGLAVLRAAQLSQDRGCSWGEALAQATDTAVRFLDLVSDPVFAPDGPPHR